MDVWPENWDAARVMLRAQTQWRRAGMSGQRYALDYAALEAVMRMLQVHDPADCLDRIIVIEQEMLRIEREANR